MYVFTGYRSQKWTINNNLWQLLWSYFQAILVGFKYSLNKTVLGRSLIIFLVKCNWTYIKIYIKCKDLYTCIKYTDFFKIKPQKKQQWTAYRDYLSNFKPSLFYKCIFSWFMAKLVLYYNIQIATHLIHFCSFFVYFFFVQMLFKMKTWSAL